MTGRALYDRYCSTRIETLGTFWSPTIASNFRAQAPIAWPYLPGSERRLWNALAQRLTPKRKVRR